MDYSRQQQAIGAEADRHVTAVRQSLADKPIKTERDRLYAMMALINTKRQIESITRTLAALETERAALDRAICRYEHGAPL